MTFKTLCVLCVLCGSLTFAQNYKCDWSVVGIGGGEMSSSAYKCAATAGQTAAGFVTASNYWALIGYWLPEGQVGVEEEAKWSGGQAVETRLYTPRPNPFRGGVAIRYSLNAERQTLLQVHDLSGRAVRTLCASSVKRGAYSVTWDGRDDRGRTLANGIYFCRFSAGDFRAVQKVVLQR